MLRRWRRRWLAAVLGSTLLLGCERSVVRPTYPPDPLFLDKHPVAGKAETARPLLAHNEPVAPPLPATAVATAPRDRLATVKLTPMPGGPVQAIPTVRTHETLVPPATPVSRQQEQGSNEYLPDNHR